MFYLVVLIMNILLISAKHFEEHNYGKGTSELLHYKTYDEVIDYLSKLQKTYPEKVYVVSIGTTHEGRDIPAVRISGNMYEEDRPIILIDSGIHAREWMTTAVALNIIHQLVLHDYMIQTIDWLIIPLLNPDGYEYSRSITGNRLWRKNRARGIRCDGVDLNRNFGFHWGERGASRNECSLNYAGPAPFSEPETRAIRDLTLKFQKNIKLSLGLHTYGEQILYPWGYAHSLVTNTFEHEHYNLGLLVSDAISTIRGSRYTVGRLGSALYLASGVSNDWMAGVAKIPLCFVIEINNITVGFAPPERDILPTSKEIFKAIEIFHKYVEMSLFFKVTNFLRRRRKSHRKL